MHTREAKCMIQPTTETMTAKVLVIKIGTKQLTPAIYKQLYQVHPDRRATPRSGDPLSRPLPPRRAGVGPAPMNAPTVRRWRRRGIAVVTVRSSPCGRRRVVV